MKITLSKLQKDTLRFCGRNDFCRKNFYWTGGTLLAYQYLQNRLSVDVDLFSDDLFSDDEYLFFINKLKACLKVGRITLNQQHNRKMYLIERKEEQLKLELVFFPFPAVEKRKTLDRFSFCIDSLSDIMVNKTLSTYQRNEVKDVYDMYCYLSRKPKYDLAKLISLVEKKFGIAIETALLLAKINTLADELESLQPLLVKRETNLQKKVKNFFQDIFNSFAKKTIR